MCINEVTYGKLKTPLKVNGNLKVLKQLKVLPTCFQGIYRDNLGEFSSTSYGGFGAEKDKTDVSLCKIVPVAKPA